MKRLAGQGRNQKKTLDLSHLEWIYGKQPLSRHIREYGQWGYVGRSFILVYLSAAWRQFFITEHIIFKITNSRSTSNGGTMPSVSLFFGGLR